jgi:hypothetical protein
MAQWQLSQKDNYNSFTYSKIHFLPCHHTKSLGYKLSYYLKEAQYISIKKDQFTNVMQGNILCVLWE